MSKHTKGPWKVRENGGIMQAIEAGKDWLIYKCGRDNTPIAEVEANARLIAAAPDLLEALELARLFIRNGIELGYIRMPDADTPDPAHDTLPKIEAAIAKARSAS